MLIEFSTPGRACEALNIIGSDRLMKSAPSVIIEPRATEARKKSRQWQRARAGGGGGGKAAHILGMHTRRKWIFQNARLCTEGRAIFGHRALDDGFLLPAMVRIIMHCNPAIERGEGERNNNKKKGAGKKECKQEEPRLCTK